MPGDIALRYQFGLADGLFDSPVEVIKVIETGKTPPPFDLGADIAADAAAGIDGVQFFTAIRDMAGSGFLEMRLDIVCIVFFNEFRSLFSDVFDL